MHFLATTGLYALRSLILTATFIVCGYHASFAQLNAFAPAGDDNVLLKTLAIKYEQEYRHEVAALPADNRKEMEELYKLQWENVREKFDSKEIYTSVAAQRYLNALVAEIVKANPALQKQVFSCHFSKSGVPNASYIGEGVILFNMGLFSTLDNESEAVFVLCHEISHFLLNHSENSIKKYVNTINSGEVQQALKKIKSSEYKKREDLEKLLKGLTFDSRRHSRDHESEADSMAVELMRTTRFDSREALTTLALLDTIDIDTFKTDIFLTKIFNAKEYPFQPKWIAKEEGLLGGHAELKEDEQIADSLKTHPDCKTRIKILNKLLAKYQRGETQKNIIDTITFVRLKKDFMYEVIEYAYATNNYTASLYRTLQLLQAEPRDAYLVTQVGKILNGLYDAEKSHSLGKVASLPSPSYPSSYNLLLQFIQNLYREDLASINYHFLRQYQPELQSYEPYKKEYNKCIEIGRQ